LRAHPNQYFARHQGLEITFPNKIHPHYYAKSHYLIARAAFYGICCFIYPLYDGYGAVEPDGMYPDLAHASGAAVSTYGAFLGNRYEDYPNIVWIGAGDDDEPGAPGYPWNALATAMQSADPNHIFTALPARPGMGYCYSNFVTLNSTYASQYSYEQSKVNYQLSPVAPSFLLEGYYENRTGVPGFPSPLTAQNCRQFAYWSVFSGEKGCFYGDENLYPFGAGWKTEMWDSGATTMTNLLKLVRTRPWPNCVPDFNHAVVTSGYGTLGSIDYITTTLEASGKCVMAYFPQDRMTATVDMTKVSGSTANAWWYNPQTGGATLIGSYSTSGTKTFTPPDTNDWVLVLDDASQNYGTPGSSGGIGAGFISGRGVISGAGIMQ
jgi:hypothetical protein